MKRSRRGPRRAGAGKPSWRGQKPRWVEVGAEPGVPTPHPRRDPPSYPVFVLVLGAQGSQEGRQHSRRADMGGRPERPPRKHEASQRLPVASLLPISLPRVPRPPSDTREAAEASTSLFTDLWWGKSRGQALGTAVRRATPTGFIIPGNKRPQRPTTNRLQLVPSDLLPGPRVSWPPTVTPGWNEVLGGGADFRDFP